MSDTAVRKPRRFGFAYRTERLHVEKPAEAPVEYDVEDEDRKNPDTHLESPTTPLGRSLPFKRTVPLADGGKRRAVENEVAGAVSNVVHGENGTTSDAEGQPRIARQIRRAYHKDQMGTRSFGAGETPRHFGACVSLLVPSLPQSNTTVAAPPTLPWYLFDPTVVLVRPYRGFGQTLPWF